MEKLLVSNQQAVVLGATIGTCMLIMLENNLPPEGRVTRKIRSVEKALLELANLSKCELDDEMTEIAIGAWNEAVNYMNERMAVNG